MTWKPYTAWLGGSDCRGGGCARRPWPDGYPACELAENCCLIGMRSSESWRSVRPLAKGDVVLGESLPEAPKLRTKRRRLRPLLVDAQTLAKLLSCGVRTVRTMDYAGRLPRPLKLNARTLWYLPEITRWLEAGAPDRETWESLKAEAQRSRRK